MSYTSSSTEHAVTWHTIWCGDEELEMLIPDILLFLFMTHSALYCCRSLALITALLNIFTQTDIQYYTSYGQSKHHVLFLPGLCLSLRIQCCLLTHVTFTSLYYRYYIIFNRMKIDIRRYMCYFQRHISSCVAFMWTGGQFVIWYIDIGFPTLFRHH